MNIWIKILINIQVCCFIVWSCLACMDKAGEIYAKKEASLAESITFDLAFIWFVLGPIVGVGLGILIWEII